jgi:hypothetical protein
MFSFFNLRNVDKFFLLEKYKKLDPYFFYGKSIMYNSEIVDLKKVNSYINADLIYYFNRYNVVSITGQTVFNIGDFIIFILNVVLKLLFNYILVLTENYMINYIIIFIEYIVNAGAKFSFYLFFKMSLFFDGVYINYDIDSSEQLY